MAMLVENQGNKKDAYVFPSFSIFSPEPLEKVEDVEESDKIDYSERPPSPLDEVIQHPPKLFENFLEILRERVKPNPACLKLTIEQQEGLISIIFSEVYSCWHKLCESINDPHLNTQQNRKVHILLFINVVEICQELFANYLSKIDRLDSKGVFSKAANFSRIKGSLISEANQQLNIHRLRQKILHRFKNFHKTVPVIPKATPAEQSKQNVNRYFDQVIAKTASVSNDLNKKISDIESKMYMTHISEYPSSKQVLFRPDSAGTQYTAQLTAESVIQSRVPSCQSRMPDKVQHSDSVVLRHRDLDFLLSENRVPPKAVVDDEEELSAILQASTKSTAPRKRKVKPQRSRTITKGSDDLLDMTPKPVQPAITTNIMPDKTVVRTSDIRVSERVAQSDMILELSPCLYNQLKDEIDETDITFLDRNLFMGQEIKEVYSEIYKTIAHDHLNFTSKMEDPCPALPSNETYYNSGILKKKRYKNRRINENIKVFNVPPWFETTREEWEAANHFHGSEINTDPSEMYPSQLIKIPVFSDYDTNNFGATGNGGNKEVKSSKECRSYTNWLQWWKSIMSVDDYQQYMARRESDYLALIFHLYDSEEEIDSADERDVALENELKQEQEKRDKKMQEMLEEKNRFEDGYWNANAVLMGGLGRDPELDVKELLPITEFHAKSISTVPKISRMASAGSSSRKSVASKLTSKSAKSTIPGNEESGAGQSSGLLTLEVKMLQDRLENIWKKLEMPEEDKIDMTIKYCKFDVKRLNSVVDLWDSACHAITSREKLILELEEFEKDASDPQRLFGKNMKTTRLSEERRRTALHRRIKKCEKQVQDHVSKVQSKLGDIVTYQGRVYREKMIRDITEMLYWLQQERRQNALETGGMVMLDLPPLSPVDLIG